MRTQITLLTVIFCLWFNGCASTAPLNHNNGNNTHPELFATDGFKINLGKWFHVKEFDQAMAKQKASLNAPDHVMQLFDSMLPKTRPMEMQMRSESNKHQSAFLSLVFYVEPNVDINFQTGGILLTLKGPNGAIIEARDRGCLFVYQKDREITAYDSARGQVIFNRDFNNKPDYKVKPNIVWVRLEPKYLDWEVLSLKIDKNKVFAQFPAVSRTH